MSYWSFSDVFEEGGVVRTPFYGGFGAIAAGNIPKPAYNAFQVLHRLGDIALSDSSVAVVASSPHRGEAFEAARFCIDTLKETVPIWKREHGPDGPYWVGWEDARCSPDHGVHDRGHAHHGHRHE